jgi:hypothetical protein
MWTFPNTAAAPADFRAVWHRDGAVLVPKLLSADETRRLTAFVAEAYRICDRLVAQTAAVDRDLLDNFTLWRGIPIDALERHLRTHAPDRETELRAIRRAVAAAVNRSFGTTGLRLSRQRRLRDRSFFRRHHDSSKHVPWHIDADAAETARLAPDCFNVWLPLAEVGVEAPSLEFVLGSHRSMRQTALLDGDWRYRTEDWVDGHASGRRWVPTLVPGDAVVFDQYTLHRTQTDATGHASRDSCEFRFMTVPQAWLRHAKPIAEWAARRALRRLSG